MEGNSGIGIGLEQLLDRKDQPGVILVDARPHNEYLGDDDVWLRKGHIPGAISYHWARLMEQDNTHQFRDLKQVKVELEAAGLTPNKQIIVYCGTIEACASARFSDHFVEHPNVRVFSTGTGLPASNASIALRVS